MSRDEAASSFLLIAIIILAGTLTYLNSLPGILFWDNEALILKNIFLRSFRCLPQIFTTSVMAGGGEVSNYYRPIPVTFLLIQFQLWGTSPFGYHAVNILLHLTDSALLFVLAEHLFKDRKTAFWAGILFALHPINNETVNYIDHQEGMLALLFGLTTLLAHIRRHRLFSLAAWILCLLSKEEGIVFLPLLGLYTLLQDQKTKSFSRLRALAPYAAACTVYIVARLTVFNFLHLPLISFGAQQGAYGPLGLRLLTFAKALLTYFRLLVWPTGLHFDRAIAPASSLLDPIAWGSGLADAALLGFLFLAARSSTARFGILWFCIALLPYCGLVPFNNILAEHFLYIPAAGLFLTVAAVGSSWLPKMPRPAAAAIAAALLGFYAVSDFRRNRDWQEPMRIYETTLAGNPKSFRAANNLGVECFRGKRLEDARKAFLRALAMKPNYAPALNNMGVIEETQGKPAVALSWYQRSIAADPTYAAAYKNMARIRKDNPDRRTR